MYMSEEKLNEIIGRYRTLLVLDGDASEAMRFAQDVLEAEADAIKAREPEATASVDRLDIAAYEVYCIGNDIEDEAFD